VWTAEAQAALDKVKELLTKASILVPLVEKEPLLLYITATTQVVSAALVVEREEAGHGLLYQQSLSQFQDPLPQIQKLLYAILVAKRNLRHYFESHSVMVVTSFPLGEMVQNRDATGRIA
jgi:hypothetical protein